MYNPVQFTNEVQITGATTLGFAPGNTPPSQLVLCTGSAGYTLTLPPVQDTLASQPTLAQPVTVGANGGYRITVYNQQSGSITVAANTTADTFFPTAATLAQNAFISYQGSLIAGAWVKVG